MKRILLIGAGGLGAPAARVLARTGGVHLTIVDDDEVERSNLHRQVLYREEDVGRPKAEVAAERLAADAKACGVQLDIETVHGRFVPTNALDLARDHDLVLEGADNFATKFLTADACFLANVPSVQAGAVRWSGWTLGSVPGETACLRCVFEDIPRDRVETCAEAGVIGPVVGVLGAIEASIALRLLGSELREGAGALWSYAGLEGRLRSRPIRPRTACPLCGTHEIRDLDVQRYVAPCAA